jgi:hypothetical protein
VSASAFLAKGTYTIRFAAATRDGSLLPSVKYRLKGLKLDDPVGPEPTDSSSSPSGSSGSGSGGSGDSWTWNDGGVPPQDNYGDPWWG